MSDLATIGHNNPPSDAILMAEKMRELYPQAFKTAEQLLAETAVPEEINDEDTAGKVGDDIKKLTGAEKSLEALRKSEKEEYLAKGRLVDGTFKKPIESLQALKGRLALVAGAYKDRKDAELRRQREEEARRQREESEAKLREAERLRAEAEADRKRIEEERRAQEAAATAERERIQREADEARKAQEAEIQRLKDEQAEKDRKAREEIAAMKADADKKDEESRAALAAAEQRRKDDAAAHKAKMEEAEADRKRIEADRREQEKALREQERATEQSLKEQSKAARDSERASDRVLDEATRHDKAAQKMDKAALNANDRIRGEEGSVLTTRHVWLGQMKDRATLDLEALRQHIPEAALHTAVQSFVDAGGRQLRGSHIFEDTQVQVR